MGMCYLVENGELKKKFFIFRDYYCKMKLLCLLLRHQLKFMLIRLLC